LSSIGGMLPPSAPNDTFSFNADIRGGGREANRAKEGGNGEVYEELLEMRHFRVLGARLRRSWPLLPADVAAREGKDEKETVQWRRLDV